MASEQNETIIPFNRETDVNYVWHYRPDELYELIGSCGFRVEKVFAQGDDNMIQDGEDGETILVEARKV